MSGEFPSMRYEVPGPQKEGIVFGEKNILQLSKLEYAAIHILGNIQVSPYVGDDEELVDRVVNMAQLLLDKCEEVESSKQKGF